MTANSSFWNRSDLPTLACDPFYTSPSGLDALKPGTVLRSRPAQVSFFGRIRHRATSVQLMYRSTDSHGQAEAAVTTVVIPRGKDPATCPVLSYQCAIDAVAPRCFPSYALRHGAELVGASVQAELLFITAALKQGWAVSIPDHEGLNGLWGAPYEAGFRALDGLRAAVGHPELGLAADSPMALWGYSGGGLASGWAAEAAAAHAPELDIVGAVLGSPVVDPESVARRLNASPWAGLAALMIASLVHVFPEAKRIVDDHATDDGKALLGEIEGMSTGAAIRRFRNFDIADFVDISFEDLFALPELRHVFEVTRLGQQVPTMPILLIQGVHDKIVDVVDVDKLAQTYVDGGAAVSYHRDPLAEHLLLYPVRVPISLRWLRGRLANTDRPNSRHSWPALLDTRTYFGLANLVVAAASQIVS
ncbi:lipase [Mycolicibacterium fluoranthenivorans]|uniref:Lipase n=1 Tax=Mycolicibacterium fluoranthenivorans TaxID=258505 RepID=A0A7G8P6Y1_9MYCO|nr:lipase family protein [Mycolicibacterium fluoranthenivorans]QNJ90097.1 lipase [Mycolicibacterium fluoranthenivorans]